MANAFHLRNGTILLSTEAPGGIYNAVQLKKIAALCDSHVAIVRATEDQRLALFVKDSEAAKVMQELKAIGLGVRHYQDGLHQAVSCIGELCPDHEQDAMGAAMALSKALDAVVLASPLKIGINGCARCCVPCHTFDVSVVGEANGYRVSLGGKNSQIPEMATFMAEGVPAKELPKLLTQVVQAYREHAQDGESLQDVMERVGSDPFITALAPYSQDASSHVSDPFAEVGQAAADDLAELGEAMAVEESAELGATATTDESADLGQMAAADEPGELGQTAAVDDLAELEQTTSADELADLGQTMAVDELGELEDISFDDIPAGDEEAASSMPGQGAERPSQAFAATADEPELIEDFAGVQQVPGSMDEHLVEESQDFDIDPHANAMSHELASEIPIGADMDLGLGDDIPMGMAEPATMTHEVMEAAVATPSAKGTQQPFDALDDMEPELIDMDAETDPALSAELATIDDKVVAGDDSEMLMSDADMLEDVTDNLPDMGEVAVASQDDKDADADNMIDATTDADVMLDTADDDAMLDTAGSDDMLHMAGDAALDTVDDGMQNAATADVMQNATVGAMNETRALNTTVASVDDSEDLREHDASTEALSEEGESNFEESFSRVIEEEASVPDLTDADENQGERQEALSILEHTEAHAVAAPDESFGVLGEGQAMARGEPSRAVTEDLTRMTTSMTWDKEHEPAAITTLASRKAQSMTSKGSLNLASFQVSDDGKLRLSFDSGMAISFDPKTMQGEKRTINVSGKPVTISCTAEGYQLELDGVELFYPAA